MKKKFKLTALSLIGAAIMVVTACGSKGGGAALQSETAAVTTEAASVSEAAAASAEDTGFSAGTSESSVYTNTMFNIKFDAASNKMSLADAQELKRLGDMTADAVDSDSAQASLDNGSVYFDMYAYNDDYTRTVNVVIQNMGIVYGVVGDLDASVEAAVSVVRQQFEALGVTDVNIEKTRVEFKGEEVPCLNIELAGQGVKQCQKQVYVKSGKYVAVISATGTDAESAQAGLDIFTAAK